MKMKDVSFWVGIVIIIATHIYMLVAGLPQNQMMPHAILNLIAGGLVLGSRFIKK